MNYKMNFKIFSISIRALVSFLLTLGICVVFIFVMISNRSKVERLLMEQLILEKGIKISDVISKLLYKTNMLSSLIIQSNGDTDEFEQMAYAIIDDPAILNILVAPGGIVTDVYPLEGNEAVLGLDFFAEGNGNKEALMAIKTEDLVLGGPFDAVQGGQILVGRLPVFMNDEAGERKFWGLTSVTLKYPQALDAAGLNELMLQGFAYEIWRINPDTDQKQIISKSNGSYSPKTNYVEKEISIANTTWYFRILPVRTWIEFTETWIFIFISICVSLLLAAIVENNHELKVLKGKLEILSTTDFLTGLYNRRGLVDLAYAQMNRIERTGGNSYLMTLDLDHFKKINDDYGHTVGDVALKEITKRISRNLRSYDLFGRFGGEEFVIFAADIDEKAALNLAERIRADVCGTPIQINNSRVQMSVSIGVSRAAPLNSFEAAMEKADKALYTAKDMGRNRVVFINEQNEMIVCTI